MDHQKFEEAMRIIEGKQPMEDLNLDQCRAYLRHFNLSLGLRSKAAYLARIRTHRRLCENPPPFPSPSSFTMRCNNEYDVCENDYIMFEQNDSTGSRKVAARVVFISAKCNNITVEVNVSDGDHPLPLMSTLVLKKTLFRRSTILRQEWADETERDRLLQQYAQQRKKPSTPVEMPVKFYEEYRQLSDDDDDNEDLHITNVPTVYDFGSHGRKRPAAAGILTQAAKPNNGSNLSQRFDTNHASAGVEVSIQKQNLNASQHVQRNQSAPPAKRKAQNENQRAPHDDDNSENLHTTNVPAVYDFGSHGRKRPAAAGILTQAAKPNNGNKSNPSQRFDTNHASAGAGVSSQKQNFNASQHVEINQSAPSAKRKVQNENQRAPPVKRSPESNETRQGPSPKKQKAGPSQAARAPLEAPVTPKRTYKEQNEGKNKRQRAEASSQASLEQAANVAWNSTSAKRGKSQFAWKETGKPLQEIENRADGGFHSGSQPISFQVSSRRHRRRRGKNSKKQEVETPQDHHQHFPDASFRNPKEEPGSAQKAGKMKWKKQKPKAPKFDQRQAGVEARGHSHDHHVKQTPKPSKNQKPKPKPEGEKKWESLGVVKRPDRRRRSRKQKQSGKNEGIVKDIIGQIRTLANRLQIVSGISDLSVM